MPGRGRVYRLPVTVEHYGDERQVEIAFEGSAQVPRISVDGPGSPHRFGDRTLCIWHPDDPREQRWALTDGLFALIGLIRLHLFREAYWREFDVWPGPEAPHGPPPKDRAEEAAA